MIWLWLPGLRCQLFRVIPLDTLKAIANKIHYILVFGRVKNLHCSIQSKYLRADSIRIFSGPPVATGLLWLSFLMKFVHI